MFYIAPVRGCTPLQKESYMNDVILHEKNESMFFAISVVLSLYCEFIYDIAHNFHNEALIFVENELYVERAFQVHINDLIDDFDFYKRMKGTGDERLEDIDITALKEKVILAHKQAVKSLVMKNLNANLRAKEEGHEYRKLKIFNRIHD